MMRGRGRDAYERQADSGPTDASTSTARDLLSFTSSWLGLLTHSTGSPVRTVTQKLSYVSNRALVPLAIGGALLQSSLYDVPGGYRAVMFDRFSGVRDKVCQLR
jgi:hypothetical protein